MRQFNATDARPASLVVAAVFLGACTPAREPAPESGTVSIKEYPAPHAVTGGSRWQKVSATGPTVPDGPKPPPQNPLDGWPDRPPLWSALRSIKAAVHRSRSEKDRVHRPAVRWVPCHTPFVATSPTNFSIWL